MTENSMAGSVSRADDVIVVGAGIVGASTALQLTLRGHKVRVIDRLPPGNGCSFGNAGIIAVDHVAPLANLDTLLGLRKMLTMPEGPLRLRRSALLPLAPWFMQFALASLPARFERNKHALASLICGAAGAWGRLGSIDAIRDVYRDIGALYVYERRGDPPRSSGDRPGHESRYLSHLDEFGVHYTTLSADVLRSDYLPELTADVSHGRFFPEMASVINPARAVEQITRAACEAGAIFTRSNVRHVACQTSMAVTVVTEDATFTAPKVVICAGVESRGLLKGMGISIPLIRERGYHVMLNSPKPHVLPMPVSFVEGGFSCNPMEEGIRLAGTVEFGVGEEPDWDRANMLAAHFEKAFPATGPVEIASRWVGDRPTLPDYLPMIGALPGVPGVWLGTGHQHLGLTLGPLTGELLAQLISSEQPAIDLLPFRVGRFSGVHLA